MQPDTTVRFLVVSPDPSLEEEFESALRAIKGYRPVATYAHDDRSGVESARVRMPDVVVIELGSHLADVRALAEEISVAAPDAVIVTAYRRQMFDDPDEENAAIIQILRARVQDFLQRPISVGELQDTIDRAFRRPTTGRGPRGRVVSFVSNKGGVGKSTVSMNVACELGRRFPGRVLLVDASLQLGVCASALDLEPVQTITDAAQQLDRLDTMLLQQLTLAHPSGLRVLAAPSTVLAASEVDDRVISRVISLARRTYEYVVVDTFPALDGVTMSILDLSNIVGVVTQVVVPVLNGTASLLETFRQIGVDENRLWVILNRGQPRFPGALHPQDIEEHLGVPLRHEVPYDRRAPSAVNLGLPLVLQASRFSRFRKAIAEIVDDVIQYAPALSIAEQELVDRDADSDSGADSDHGVPARVELGRVAFAGADGGSAR